MTDERINRLTDGQRDCLRLVYARMEIKQIATELGIAPATVNQRLAVARKTLGATRSLDAARILATYEQPATYIRPLYTPNSMAGEVVPGDSPAPSGPAGSEHAPPVSEGGVQWPFATAGKPRNEMSVTQRVGWTFGIAIAAMLAFAVMLSALDTFSRIF